MDASRSPPAVSETPPPDAALTDRASPPVARASSLRVSAAEVHGDDDVPRCRLPWVGKSVTLPAASPSASRRSLRKSIGADEIFRVSFSDLSTTVELSPSSGRPRPPKAQPLSFLVPASER